MAGSHLTLVLAVRGEGLNFNSGNVLDKSWVRARTEPIRKYLSYLYFIGALLCGCSPSQCPDSFLRARSPFRSLHSLGNSRVDLVDVRHFPGAIEDPLHRLFLCYISNTHCLKRSDVRARPRGGFDA